MNAFQQLWWEQTRADHAVLSLLSGRDENPCHQLHYLQMVTEKLAKAYFWRSGAAPAKKSHVAFVQFLLALNDRLEPDLTLIATRLGFADPDKMQAWILEVSPLARDLERLAPSLAGDGPNPEYPWPPAAPTHAPATHSFEIWGRLHDDAGPGPRLLAFIDSAVARFPDYC